MVLHPVEDEIDEESAFLLGKKGILLGQLVSDEKIIQFKRMKIEVLQLLLEVKILQE
jgi:hypothetical protein